MSFLILKVNFFHIPFSTSSRAAAPLAGKEIWVNKAVSATYDSQRSLAALAGWVAKSSVSQCRGTEHTDWIHNWI